MAQDQETPHQAPAPAQTRPPREYWCFISYRHADNQELGRQWATWLHQTIETYQVPEDLAGQKNSRGDVIPERIFPVFRDEESLAADSDLSTRIYEALDHSKIMVILCSPKTLKSPHVRSEIAHFKKIGKADKIIAAILYGEPYASRNEDVSDGLECFPEELRYEVDGDGNIIPDAECEPLAADFRLPNSQDQGWTSPEAYRNALEDEDVLKREEIAARVSAYEKRLERNKLKIIAGILGRPLGELTQRDKTYQLELARKRTRRLRIWLSIVGILGVVAAALGLLANQLRGLAEERQQAAEAARNDANNLVGFMLDDLQPELESVGRLEVLEGVVKEVDGYLVKLGKQADTDWNAAKSEVRMRISRATILRSMGKISEAIPEMRTALAQARKASGLAPSQAEADALIAAALLRLGDILAFEEDDGLVREAGEHLRESIGLLVPQQGEGASLESSVNLAAATMYLGDVYEQLKDEPKTIETYARAIQQAFPLVEQPPSSGEDAHKKHYQQAGLILLESLDRKGRALTQFRTQMDEIPALSGEMERIAELLSARYPKDIRWRAFQPKAQLMRGTALGLNSAQDALPPLQDAERLQRELCAYEPLNVHWKLSLSAILYQLGEVSDQIKAREYYQDSLTTTLDAAKSAEGNAYLLSFVIDTLINLAVYYIDQDPAKAIPVLEQAKNIRVKIDRTLTEGENSNASLTALVAIESYFTQAYLNLAKPAKSDEKLAELIAKAAQHSQEAMTHVKAQGESGDLTQNQIFTSANVYINAGEVLMLQDNLDEAAQRFQEGASRLQPLAEKKPDAKHVGALSNSYNLLGNCQSGQEAVASFTQAIEAWEGLETDLTKLPVSRTDYADLYVSRARAYQKSDPPQSGLALADLATARTTLREIVDADPKHRPARELLATTHYWRGRYSSGAESVQAFTECLETNAELLANGGSLAPSDFKRVIERGCEALSSTPEKSSIGFITTAEKVLALLEMRNPEREELVRIRELLAGVRDNQKNSPAQPVDR